MRFANDPHNINRVVDVLPGEIEAALNALDLKVGGRVRISTQFFVMGEASGPHDNIPNWPYGKYLDYPIGVHLLTAIERVSP